jgi:uncharacterized membrane protein required for colicin V production
MTPLDWILVVLWGGITLGGFWKGAIRIVFGIGGLLVGVWLALVLGPGLSDRLAESITTPWLVTALGYLIPVVAAALLFGLAGWGIERTLKAVGMGCLNRMAGAALTGAVAAVLLGVLLVMSLGLSPEWAEVVRASLLFPYLADIADIVF